MIERSEAEIMKNWQGDIAEPLVSVCCITYNHEKYISEAIDSFLMQETTFPFEIVIDEDCSTDNTAGIVKKYAEKYPTIIRANLRKKNIGPTTNFIENMKRARGKYIALCEGDDYWTDALKLQKQVDFLDRNTEYGLVYTNFIKYIQDKNEFKDSNIRPLGYSLKKSQDIFQTDVRSVYEELMNWKSQIWTLTVCFRKDLLRDLPQLDQKKYFTGDRLIFLHISLKSKIKYIPQKTGVYRILKESASHFVDFEKELKFLYKVSNLMLFFLDKYPIGNKYIQKELEHTYMLNKLYYALMENNYKVLREIRLYFIVSIKKKNIKPYIIYNFSKIPLFFSFFSKLYKNKLQS